MSYTGKVTFYFITSNNMVLSKEAVERIGTHFALDLGFTEYTIRSGLELQDPLKLYNEITKNNNIKNINSAELIDSYDIIYNNSKDFTSTILSDRQKIEFMQELKEIYESSETGITNNQILEKILKITTNKK